MGNVAIRLLLMDLVGKSRNEEQTHMNKPTVPIENWAVVDSVSAQGWSLLKPGGRLTGWVSAHGDLPTGMICTSAIIQIDEAEGLVETRNTLYRLGRCNPDYVAWLHQSATRAA